MENGREKEAVADRPSLAEVHSSVELHKGPSFWKRLFAFAGPAYLVSVGYMDPGNWATDIAAGSRLGYGLLWVLVMSNLMAILLQSLCARLGIVAGMDLAQACRAMFNRPVSASLWFLAEIAIAACDLAEILGSAIGLQLLFGLPLLAGVLITTLDTFLLLLLHHHGIRRMEAFIVVLITTIGVCLGVEIFLSRPDPLPIVRGLIPSLAGDGALYLAIGMLGATVMPHNLYLHSALVQSRQIVYTPAGIRNGIRFNFIDSVVALNGAFLVNAALLIMAAATFHSTGHTDVLEIQDAHKLLEPILGSSIAPVAFAIALIAAGQSSTITGTLAGQIVMEGFLRVRLRPHVRRLLTRAVAILPAALTILVAGERSVGNLLVLSQVVLSLQLSFAVIPLVHLVSDRRWMGQYRIGKTVQALSWLSAAVIAGLNLRLAFGEIWGWAAASGQWAWLIWLLVIPAVGLILFLLGYVTIVPLLHRLHHASVPAFPGVHGPAAMPAVNPPAAPRRIAVALDFSEADPNALSHAVGFARGFGSSTRIVLLHVVESGAARLMGQNMKDHEARSDQARLELYCAELGELGVEAAYDLGFGNPVDELAKMAAQNRADLLIMGSHGHRGMEDLLHGTTVTALRHRLAIPVMVVPVGSHL